MSEETFDKMDKTFNEIFQILVRDELTPAQHLAILAKLITLIFEIARNTNVSEQVLLQAKIKIAIAILQS